MTKLAVGAVLVAAGYYIGHYMVPPEKPRYETMRRKGIEILVDKETKKEYIRADLPNVVKYLSKQDSKELEEVLKK